jgi:hypothetical protein
MKYALVLDDVINTVSLQPIDGWIEVPDTVFAGFIKNGNEWVAPVPEPYTPTPEERIAELKRLLAETDYVALSDYDKDKPEVLAQRQEWRDEIRALEA